LVNADPEQVFLTRKGKIQEKYLLQLFSIILNVYSQESKKLLNWILCPLSNGRGHDM
jgi:hypothetical protein